MNLLRYIAESTLAPLAHKAAAAWNAALPGVAYLYPAPLAHADITIAFGPVDRMKDAARVAQHELRGLIHRIKLASDIRWSVTPWQRFWGLGQEDALAALMHEFGHAIGLPHSEIYSDVMHHELGSIVISADEAARARAFLSKSPPLQASKS